MILQALTRYYDILVKEPKSGVAPPGYCSLGISFALVLSPQGELLSITTLFEKVQRGKKTMEVPRRMLVPAQEKRSSGIKANFLCDNSTYVLGLTAKDAKDAQYALKRFEAFRERNCALLKNVDCAEARAVFAFLNNYHPQRGGEHPVIAGHLENLLKGGNLVFKLDGQPGFVHEAAQIRKAWEEAKSADDQAVVGQCLVTGDVAPIARLHPSIKGVRDANPTGSTLVGFNARAYESYNRIDGQGLNSPVSEQAAFAYTTALNYLLSPERLSRAFTIGDTTVVYWAESDDPSYAAVVAGLFGAGWDDSETEIQDAEEAPRDQQAEQRLRQVAEKVRKGAPLNMSNLLQGLKGNPRFYVLGLAPNAGRVAVRFFYADLFQTLLNRIMQHYQDLQITKQFDSQPTYLLPYQIVAETVSKKASDPKAAPLLAGALFRSILEGSPYPAALFYSLINRIRADQDDKERRIEKISYARAAIIKAYLTRKYRRQNQPIIKEVLCMSLNEQSTNRAYLLGRLFAVLEKAQQDAVGEVNATIKDRYFTSACASPATVFPLLLRLSQHHTSKTNGHYLDNLIQKIMNLIEMDQQAIPAHLSLDEQGIFVLGYYHQRTALYTPRAKAGADTESN